MEFDYDKKESYTQEDLDKIVGQHDGFKNKQFKDYKSADEYSKVVDELKPFKAKAKLNHVKTLLSKDADETKFDDIMAIAKINDEDDDETIAKKLEDTVSKREYLKKGFTLAPEAKTIKLNKDKKDKKMLDIKLSNLF